MFVCAKCGKDHAEDLGSCDACGGPVLPIREADDSLSGRLLVDKYVLLEQLGEGGMGSVFRAKQRHLERLVAVKVLRLTHAKRKEALRRFYAEARFTSQLQHPHNAKIFDFGHTEDGLIFIAMELIQGVPLSRLPMPMSSRRLLRIADQVCGAVGEAHALGLVHRDLKPDNVMISRVDGKDFTRVLDYGIAKLENSSTGLTEQGRVIGTPQYMSPEQIAGDKLDARSDVYSLGVMLFEMATGRPPFAPEDTVALLYMHRHERPPRPSSLAPVAPALEAVILDCLAKDRADRPQSMPALRERLEAIREGRASEPRRTPTVSTEPPSPPVPEPAPGSQAPAPETSEPLAAPAATVSSEEMATQPVRTPQPWPDASLARVEGVEVAENVEAGPEAADSVEDPEVPESAANVEVAEVAENPEVAEDVQAIEVAAVPAAAALSREARSVARPGRRHWLSAVGLAAVLAAAALVAVATGALGGDGASPGGPPAAQASPDPSDHEPAPSLSTPTVPGGTQTPPTTPSEIPVGAVPALHPALGTEPSGSPSDAPAARDMEAAGRVAEVAVRARQLVEDGAAEAHTRSEPEPRASAEVEASPGAGEAPAADAEPGEAELPPTVAASAPEPARHSRRHRAEDPGPGERASDEAPETEADPTTVAEPAGVPVVDSAPEGASALPTTVAEPAAVVEPETPRDSEIDALERLRRRSQNLIH